jgi:hypothetical protein
MPTSSACRRPSRPGRRIRTEAESALNAWRQILEAVVPEAFGMPAGPTYDRVVS